MKNKGVKEGVNETDPNKLSETFKELYSLFGPHILNTDLDEKPTEGVNKGVKEMWQDMAEGLFKKYYETGEIGKGDGTEVLWKAYEAGFKDGDARDTQNRYLIKHTEAAALAQLAAKEKELDGMKQQLTHHDDVVGTLADMMLENAKLKLQLLDQATIIENLRTDRNNYRNLYEDLKQDCQGKPDIRNINKQAEPISKPYKPCKNHGPDSE
jgi:hypothetical protein